MQTAVYSSCWGVNLPQNEKAILYLPSRLRQTLLHPPYNGSCPGVQHRYVLQTPISKQRKSLAHLPIPNCSQHAKKQL
eukprot:6229693-Ditylum_brightwellii.AAC.1